MMSREDALALVKEHVSKRNWINHMLAVEAIMKDLAERFGEDGEKWGLLGLLHDIDFEETENAPAHHGLRAEELLKGKVSEDIVKAIKSHNYDHTGVKPESRMEKALIAADAVSGLIVASALVMPSKKVDEVTVETLLKKFKQKDFARGVDRSRVGIHEEVELSREEFFELALNSMKKIGPLIGL